ncbi:MAG: hypothetical protein A2868_03285 [Candidatus Levybacteria bacterium RIFCSPHIGHO2_01_FULL_40_15b]|nr:MAG: hypothetical protein A2868_03285 [Candidatus Levybacteria bacterium RIFCSPHIGHO2_01_FULL_40_15b]
MATNRKIVFSNSYVYHVFNRGIDRRNIFTDLREYSRAQELRKYYFCKEPPVSYSKFLQQQKEIREEVAQQMKRDEKLVNILAYCLMPNHFHFMLQQNSDRGIPIFVSNFTNAYTRYFNTKHERTGPMFEGIFKAVLVESDEQLVHLSRYIHLNPVVSSIINEDQLINYQWSSYQHYVSDAIDDSVNSNLVLSMFKSKHIYKGFVLDHVEYGKKLEAIKHLVLE